MPYEKHDYFRPPEGVDTIWRYMDLSKFISLLQTKSLYFPSARLLQKIDPWEGTYLKLELNHSLGMRYKYQLENNEREKNNNAVGFSFIKNQSESLMRGYEYQVDINYISCWHYNNNESAAMWRLYLKNINEGLAIKTNIDSFKASFECATEKVYIGSVKYKNYETGTYQEGYPMRIFENMFLPFLHKRNIFAHEKEYRAIIPKDPEKGKPAAKGIYVNVILEKLIESIVISPYASTWFKELLESILKEYNLKFPLKESEVKDKPYSFDLSPYEDLK